MPVMPEELHLAEMDHNQRIGVWKEAAFVIASLAEHLDMYDQLPEERALTPEQHERLVEWASDIDVRHATSLAIEEEKDQFHSRHFISSPVIPRPDFVRLMYEAAKSGEAALAD